MTRAKRERVYRNVYRVFAGVLACSAVLMFFMNVSPFGFGVSWSDGSLVFTHTRALAEVGDVVTKSGALSGQADILTVQDVARQDGELYYTVAGLASPVKAREAGNVVVFTIPLIGYWVRALSHPIGVLALIGIPLFTFALDVVAVAWAGNVRTRATRYLASLRKERAMRRRERERERLAYEEEGEQEYEFELPAPQPLYREEQPVRPVVHNAPITHGMTIRLTRPQRYGMNAQ